MKKYKWLVGFLPLLCCFFMCLTIFASALPSDFAFAVTNGGGIYVGSGANETITGGTLSNKNSTANGGGVYVDGGTFSMNGGTISSNSATNGGGIYVNNGTFNMNGGTITSNTATNGSAIYLSSSGTFNYTSGTISGEIYLDSGAFITFNGAPSTALTIKLSSTSNGTRVARLGSIMAIDLSLLNVVNLPESSILSISGGYVVVTKKTTDHTVSFYSNHETWGSVSESSIIVSDGAKITVDGNSITIGSTKVTATASEGYRFDHWEIEQDVNEVTFNITITAIFTSNDSALMERIAESRRLVVGIERNYSPLWAEWAAALAFVLSEGTDVDRSASILEYFIGLNVNNKTPSEVVEIINDAGLTDVKIELVEDLYIQDPMDQQYFDDFMVENGIDILFSDRFYCYDYDEIESNFEFYLQYISLIEYLDELLSGQIFLNPSNYSFSQKRSVSPSSIMNDYFMRCSLNLGPIQSYFMGSFGDFGYRDYIDYNLFTNTPFGLTASSDYFSNFIKELAKWLYSENNTFPVSDPEQLDRIIRSICEQSREGMNDFLVRNFNLFGYGSIFNALGYGNIFGEAAIDYSHLHLTDILYMFSINGEFSSYANVLFEEDYTYGNGGPLVKSFSDLLNLGLVQKSFYIRTSDIDDNVLAILGALKNNVLSTGIGNESIRGLWLNENFNDWQFNPYETFDPTHILSYWGRDLNLGTYNGASYFYSDTDFSSYVLNYYYNYLTINLFKSEPIIDTSKFYNEPIKDRKRTLIS